MEYHYTATPDQLEDIIRDGITPDQFGTILLSCSYATSPENYETILAAHLIATGRLHSEEFILFYVETEGITGVMGPDVTSDRISALMSVLYQDCIKPEHLFYYGRHPVDHQAIDRFYNSPELPYDEAALNEALNRTIDWPDDYDQSEMRWLIDRTT